MTHPYELPWPAGHTENVPETKPAKNTRKNDTKQANSSLPERWKKNRRRMAIVSAMLVVLCSGLMAWGDVTAYYAERWLSMRFSLRERWGGVQTDKRIAIVELDDKSLSAWPEPLIFWGAHMAKAIEHLNRSGARLIALDWMQPIETDALMKWDHDEKLGKALSESRGVVFAKFLKPSQDELTQNKPSQNKQDYILPIPALLYAAPGAAEDAGESSLGLGEVGSESNAIWKTTQPVFTDRKPPEVSFAGRIAVKAGYYRTVQELPAREIYINFSNRAGQRGPHPPFERASLWEVANTNEPDPRWKDKIVLIGATYKGSNDFHHVPFFNGWGGIRQISGVEVQAHAVKTLIDRNEIVRPSKGVRWLLASLIGALGVLFFAVWNWWRASVDAIIVALAWAFASYYFFAAANFDLPLVLPVLSLLLGSLFMGGYRALSEERERAQTLKLWGRQQDPRIINELLANPDLSGGQGREMFVTVLFADLKHFTKTVEMLPPEQAIAVLNRYLSLLAEIILHHGGWVDKYLGDGLMAQWGAPLPGEDHARLAVKACLEIENQLRTMTPELRAKGEVSFEVRLTLHSGPVIVGAVGSDKRQEFTIIGDTVNVTSRLQETAKALECNFLISEVTRGLLGETNESQIVFGKEAEVEIRGRQQPLHVYEIVAEQSKSEV